ncbi:class I SAM-dependent methyltransferase [Candidatus Kaiserbacteria bacterium]|nr:class I SAM-dependent methyltransferase [Candidatus Kaiserbacteria bacterium]
MNSELQATYDRIAADWLTDHNIDDWWIEGTERFLALLPGKKTILDAGCGAGVKSKYMSERGYSVLGVDFSEGQLRLARAAASSATFRLLALEELDTLPETFDGIFAQASLLHIRKANLPSIIAKMNTRLNDSGLLYVSVKEIKAGQPEEEVKKENKYGYDFERFFSYYTMEELESYITQAGLHIDWSGRKVSGSTVWLQIIGRKC